MSTEPIVRKSVPAFDSGPIKKITQRSLPRRIARISLRVFGGLVALVVLVIAFLHTPWGKSVVRGRIESKLSAAVNGEVSLGSLDYGFMFGSIELGELEIRDASGRTAIKVASIEIDLDRSSVIRGEPELEEVIVDGVAVDVVKNADGTTNLTGLFKPSDRKPLEHITVGKLSIAGGASITKPDGSVITVADLGIAGKLDARPASKQVDALIERISAKLAIAKPDAPTKRIDVAIDSIDVKRRVDGIDLDIASITAGALGIQGVGAHVALVDGRPRGMQNISIGKVRVDSKQLAEMVGKEIVLDDITMDLAITGLAEKLVITGAIRTRGTSLTLTGSANAAAARPTYQLAIVGKGRSADVKPGKLAIESDLTIDVTGAGISPGDLDGTLALAIGASKVGKLAVDGMTVKATAQRGAYKLDELIAKGLDFQITATGELGRDRQLHAKLDVAGSPAKATKILAAAGIALPRKVPSIDKLAVSVTAKGKLDGALDVELAPTRIAIARGGIDLAGKATLDNKKLRVASTKIRLDRLDLVELAALAGRPAKAKGTLTGALALEKHGDVQNATYELAIALVDRPITIRAAGTADATAARAHAKVVRNDLAVLATLDATLPLDAKGFQPAGKWNVSVDVARRALSDLATLLPGRKLPAGDVEIHADLAGSPAAPTGTIRIAANAQAMPGTQKVDLVAKLVPTAKGLSIGTTGTVSLDNSTLLAISGGIALPAPFATGKLDIKAMRAGADADIVVDVPERSLASLKNIRPRLAELGGTLGGKITVRGALAKPALDANLKWAGYRTAANTTGITTIAATGTPAMLRTQIAHNHAVGIVAEIDRSQAGRIAIDLRVLAPESPILPLLPASFATKLAAHEPGTLKWNMDGKVVLVKTANGLAVDTADLRGALDVQRGAIQLPGTGRRYHDVALSIRAEPAGIKIDKLSLRESDIENKDRRIDIRGKLALDKLRPAKLDLSLAARDWLVFGGDKLGMIDAPRAAASFDIGVAVDLTQPVLGVDATIHSLALHSPDRLDRAHQPERISPNGDVIYVDSTSTGKLGKLPVVPVVAAAPKKRRPMDIRIHIPKPIRLEQTPFDVMGKGELTVTVRDEGVKTRGTLTMVSGKLNLFGHDHGLVDGSLSFTDTHPQGWLALTFERQLPDIAKRELSQRAGGARISFSGTPAKPKTSLQGAANAALMEVMAMYNAGRPLNAVRPGQPATATVQAPRGDQLFMLTFMATNLPHLLFLDRMTAWSGGKYGELDNMEAEKYTADGKRRVRAVVRPTTPGRSNAELQYDRVLINSDRAAAGVGIRAGDRLGGGVGVFVEWSSKD